MSFLEKLVEQKILQAQQEGAFDNLPGTGKPLVIEDDSSVPQDLRLAFKILKNSHCLPPEMELHKEILRLKDLLDTVQEKDERVRRVREINLLVTKLNLLRRKPLPLETRQIYAARLLKSDAKG